MPVRKYYSVEEMEDTFWTDPGTPSHENAVGLVLEFVSFFASKRHPPRGVFKFESIEQASAQREKWEKDLYA